MPKPLCTFFFSLIILFLLLFFLILSCIPAFPPVTASARNASCIFYEYKGEFCKDIITSLYVYGNQTTLDLGEVETKSFNAYFEWLDISEQCQPIIKDLYCRYYFRPCDESLGEPTDRRICRSSCDYLMDDVCKKEADVLKMAVSSSPDFNPNMINCSFYQPANGGDAPECYEWPDIPGECYITATNPLSQAETWPEGGGEEDFWSCHHTILLIPS